MTLVTRVMATPPKVTPVTGPPAGVSVACVAPTPTATSKRRFGPVPGVWESVRLVLFAMKPLLVAAAPMVDDPLLPNTTL